MKLSWEGGEQRKEMQGRRKRKGNRSLLGRWQGGECSHSGARPGGRSHCWPVPGGAAQFFLPPQPAGREPVTMLCCPLSSRAWPDSLRTGLCSALALEGGRQQRPLISPGKGTSQLALHGMSQPCCPLHLQQLWALEPSHLHHSQLYSEREGMQLGHTSRRGTCCPKFQG